MKKQLLSLACLLLGAALGVAGCLLVGFLRDMGEQPGDEHTELPGIHAQPDGTYSGEALLDAAYDVARCLRSGDYEALAQRIHPEFGLIFSPYSTINLGSNQCFTPNRVAYAQQDDTIYVWGTRYGTDEPIQLTTEQYFAAYVYDRDYLNAPMIGLNQVLKSGNALENVSGIFTEGQFVDLCFPGTAPDGTGWSILRMVFEPYGDDLRLSALIHSTYTE